MNYKIIDTSYSSSVISNGKEVQNDDGRQFAYQVFEKEKAVADFLYHIESDCLKSFFEENASGAEMNSVFWIDDITLKSEFADYKFMDSILQFLQYKCWTAGCQSMYVRLNMRNLFYMEMYKQYGFFMFSQEEKQISYGQTVYECVMKYALPGSKEEAFRHYIRRREG